MGVAPLGLFERTYTHTILPTLGCLFEVVRCGTEKNKQTNKQKQKQKQHNTRLLLIYFIEFQISAECDDLYCHHSVVILYCGMI